MDAHVEEPGMGLQQMLVPGDDLIHRVGDDLIVEPPLRKWRSGTAACRVRDVVTLPRVRPHVLDLPLRVVAEERIGGVSGSGIQLRMSKRSPGPR